jgi:hypothetical protein
VKRFLAALAAAIGVGAFLGRRRRRHNPVTAEPSPADELREKLAEAEARAVTGEEATEAGHDEVAADVDIRRREVHEQARHTLDELR